MSVVPTAQDVQALLALPNKQTIRSFAWTQQASGHLPKIHLFESAIQVGPQVQEGLRLRASYRGAKNITRGQAHVSLPEKFECALLWHQCRIAALDTNPVQRHFNKVGTGLPFFNQTLPHATHRHIWTGQYGYAEPVEPPLLDVTALIQTFALECHLRLNGNVVHPLHGTQGELL